jgi:hypothetical protein
MYKVGLDFGLRVEIAEIPTTKGPKPALNLCFTCAQAVKLQESIQQREYPAKCRVVRQDWHQPLFGATQITHEPVKK